MSRREIVEIGHPVLRERARELTPEELGSDDVQRLFPQAPQVRAGLQLFALLSASGEPIVLTDSRDAAIANAWAHDLTTVSLH